MSRLITYQSGGFTNCGISYRTFSQEELEERTMGITELRKNERIRYQQRYVGYLRRWNKTHNEDDRGHFLECSYVLINIFGLTADQVTELEQNDYAGFTKKDLEDR